MELFKNLSIANYYEEKIHLINKIFIAKGEMSLTLYNKQQINIVPICFAYKKNCTTLNYIEINTRKHKEIPLNKIVKIAQIGQEEILPTRTETIFELYGRLADVYVLKDGERVIDYKKEKIVIANGYEDKGILFKRLLRYDVLCKITHPKEDVQEFKNLLAKIIGIFKETDEKNK